MAREWGFFSSLLSNMDMVLAKSDIAIASRYAGLVRDVKLREAIFGRIRAEHEASVAALLEITGQHELLDANPLPQALDPQPLPLSRPAQPRPGRAAAPPPRGQRGRPHQGRHPHVDQRHRRRAQEQRLRQSLSGFRVEARNPVYSLSVALTDGHCRRLIGRRSGTPASNTAQ